MDHATRAASFDRDATAYERYRPSYPLEAVHWVLARAPGRAVVDLAAGTGKLTERLVELRHTVTAVEPLAGMRAQLAAKLPETNPIDGTAEAMGLPDSCADAVTVGQAFHWFDHARAAAEIRRVLRPSGTLGALWNLRDERVPWVAALSALVGETGEYTRLRYFSEDTTLPGFEPFEYATFEQSQPIDADGLAGLIGSRSYALTLPPDERASLLAAVRDLALRHPDLKGQHTFLLPYVTAAFRARRAV